MVDQGTSDPVVYVEAFGQKFATEVKEACLSCVFDETFVIGLRNMDKDEFEEGVIRYAFFCFLSLLVVFYHYLLYVYRTLKPVHALH